MRRLKDYRPGADELEGREPDITLLSLGGGVQSSALAVMAYSDQWPEIPSPDAVIRSEIHAETPETNHFLREHLYPWLEKMEATVHIIDGGSLYRHTIQSAREKNYTPLPVWSETETGEIGPLPHDCCHETKVKPIIKKTRSLLGIKPREHASGQVVAEMWLGISLEETNRARPGWEPWLRYRYPLIEQKLDRSDCQQVFQKEDLPTPPRSSCWFCPLQSNDRWKMLVEKHPNHMKAAVKMDEIIRDKSGDRPCFLHRSGRPIKEIFDC